MDRDYSAVADGAVCWSQFGLLKIGSQKWADFSDECESTIDNLFQFHLDLATPILYDENETWTLLSFSYLCPLMSIMPFTTANCFAAPITFLLNSKKKLEYNVLFFCVEFLKQDLSASYLIP